MLKSINKGLGPEEVNYPPIPTRPSWSDLEPRIGFKVSDKRLALIVTLSAVILFVFIVWLINER